LDILVAEPVDGLNAEKLALDDRVKELEVSLKANHAALAKKKESNVGELSGNKKRNGIDFAALGDDRPDFPGIGIEPFAEVLVLTPPKSTVYFHNKVEGTALGEVLRGKAAAKNRGSSGAPDGRVNNALEDFAAELIAFR
jgi:hypothetical protein